MLPYLSEPKKEQAMDKLAELNLLHTAGLATI